MHYHLIHIHLVRVLPLFQLVPQVFVGCAPVARVLLGCPEGAADGADDSEKTALISLILLIALTVTELQSITRQYFTVINTVIDKS